MRAAQGMPSGTRTTVHRMDKTKLSASCSTLLLVLPLLLLLQLHPYYDAKCPRIVRNIATMLKTINIAFIQFTTFIHLFVVYIHYIKILARTNLWFK